MAMKKVVDLTLDGPTVTARVVTTGSGTVYVAILSAEFIEDGTLLPPQVVYVRGTEAARALRDVLSAALGEIGGE